LLYRPDKAGAAIWSALHALSAFAWAINMPAQSQYEPNDICVLRISGILKRSEFGAEQSGMALKIDVGLKPRLLIILEDFEGWERGADWNDLAWRQNF